jgi:hypothetical protein
MSKGIFIAAMYFSNIAADEFNDWYDTEHIRERQRVRGFSFCIPGRYGLEPRRSPSALRG